MTLIEKNRLHEIVSLSKGKSVLVVGDLILDKYVSIEARKISREAPVPVGDLQGERLSLGGAANLANNISSLGGKVQMLGYVGADPEGEWIRRALSDKGIGTTGIETYNRPTSLKTRYMVNGVQFLRVDREIRSDTSGELSDKLLGHADSFVRDSDIVAFADYDKGAITSYLIDSLVTLAKAAGKKTISQPKVRHYLDYRGVDIIKSNEREASIATGISVLNDTGLRNIATNLTTRLGCKAIILTRSERGITVVEQNSMTTIPTIAIPNQYARPVGVRDAMTSVLTLAVAAGANSVEGAALANLAASLRGDRSGTIVLSADEIVQNISSAEKALNSVSPVPVRR